MQTFPRIILSKIKEADYVHKVFLKPLEVELKTNRQGGQDSIGELPQGLMNAFKKQSISEDCYQTMPFEGLNPTLPYEEIQKNEMNNLISYLKIKNSLGEPKKLELAICVCMYSQNKTMLKDSIKGIEDNIATLIREGADPDSIAVFVLMDGIEKVDSSIPDYFEQLQRESHIFLGENNIPSYSKEDIEAERNNLNKDDYTHQFASKNVNSFLFDQAELFERQERRFEHVRKEYLQASKLRSTLSKLKAENSQDLYEKMPHAIKKQFFEHEVRMWKLRDLKRKGQNLQQKALIPKTQQIIDEYRQDNQKFKIIVTEAINKALIRYNKYIQTRDNLCYVASFRKKITLPAYEKNSQNQRNQLIQQNQNLLRQMNLFMCVKYKNGGKLSSHNWFFNGFCKELNPSYSILMDVGLKPERQSICRMYTHMKNNPNVGGVCGYMRLKIEQAQDDQQIKDQQIDWLSSFTLNFVDIQKAQQLEYNFAHIIDKPFESAFKFIHVLPGAFSGYSMAALKSQDNSDKLLKEYFRSIESKLVENNIRQSNITLISVLLRVLLPQFFFNLFIGVAPESQEEMLYNQNIFFAQDRILCMQIHKNGKDLVFLPDALADVDPIKTVHGLMGQRKRWINGSYFAFEKVKKEIAKTKQCQLILRMQVLFYDFLNIFIYFAPSIFFFTVHISMIAFRTDVLQQILKPIESSQKVNQQFLDFFVYTVDLIYALILVTILFYSLTTTSNKDIYKPYIYFASTVLGLLALGVFIVFLVDIIRGLTTGGLFLIKEGSQKQSQTFKTLLQANRWIVVGVFGIYIVPLMTYCLLFKTVQPLVQALKASISFIFYSPTYFIILGFYALCRIDDISWGTKGLNSQNQSQNKMQQKWKLIKLIHVGKYVLWNIVGSVLLISFSQLKYPRFYIAFVIMISVVLTLAIKIIVGAIYMIAYKCKDIKCGKVEQRHQAGNSKMGNLITKYQQHLEKSVFQIVRQFQGMEQGGRSYVQKMKKFGSDPSYIKKSYMQRNQMRKGISKILMGQRSNIEQNNSRMYRRVPLQNIREQGQ